jgi:cytochrome c peroxidase
MTGRNTCIRYAVAFAIGIATLNAQVDPGPRSGPANVGSYYPTLNSNEQNFFNQTLARFQEVDSVSGTIAAESGSGLGPTFNGNSCAMCHAQPAIGGSSPGLTSPQNPIPNPQVALATLDGATNTVPSFITANGPVREVRFISTNPSNASAALDGGVHGLYTIAGRSDATGCNLAQPNFAAQLAASNVIFRIPTPLFGLGLVENTPDSVLQANLAANQSQKAAMNIVGVLNTSGNDGTVTRFGWKAQNKSLLIFAGEAYNVEQGVSNEVFPNERSAVAGCVFNATPEDSTNILNPDNPPSTIGTASTMSSDVVNFAAFARMLAPPVPVTSTPSQQNGQALFASVGCALCHTPALTSAASPFTGMSNVTYHPFSDFALHHMGSNLADNITQGAASGDEFRTAPLWGLGQRLFFLHDGRTADLLAAIQAHATVPCTPPPPQGGRPNPPPPPSCASETVSEANKVIGQFIALSASQQQDILNFLRSL